MIDDPSTYPAEWSKVIAAMAAPNGYTRQSALEAVDVSHASAQTLRAVLIRLNDWVPQVRIAARQALDRLWSNLTPHMLLVSLPEILSLRRAKRDNHAVFLSRIEERLLQENNPSALERIRHWMQEGDRHAAIFCYDLLVRKSLLDDVTLCAWGLECRHPQVACRAAQRLRNFSVLAAQGLQLVHKALQLRHPAVRVAALRAVRPPKEQPMTPELHALILGALLDRNGTVRATCLAMLGGPSELLRTHAVEMVDALDLTQRRRATAISLLGELGPLAPPDRIIVALEHPSPCIRQAAYGAAFKLGVPSAQDLILKASEDEALSVQRAALHWAQRLKIIPMAHDIDAIAHKMTLQGWDMMLHLLAMGNPWEMLAILLSLPEPLLQAKTARARMTKHSARWLQGMPRCTLAPTPMQRARVERLLNTHGPGVFRGQMHLLSLRLNPFDIAAERGTAKPNFSL